MEKPLYLNVGGRTFLVSAATLQRYPACILAQPTLLARAKAASDPPFIDRDPSLFTYILDFLRCELPEYYEGPPDRPTRRRVAYESRWYRLPELENALKPKKQKPAEGPDLGAVASKYVYMVCEKVVSFGPTMKPVKGYFMIEGKVETQGGWLRGFDLGKLTQDFQRQVARRLQGYLNKGYAVKHVQTSTSAQTIEPQVTGSGGSDWCHVTSTAFLLERLN